MFELSQKQNWQHGKKLENRQRSFVCICSCEVVFSIQIDEAVIAFCHVWIARLKFMLISGIH